MRGLVQLTLDFFATPEPASASSPAPPAGAENTRQTAIEFRHPRANRQIRLADATVAYEFKRGQRRTIGFSIGADGLVVSAPRWVGMSDVQAALQEKAAWILRKLDESRVRPYFDGRDSHEAPALAGPTASSFGAASPDRGELEEGAARAKAQSMQHGPGCESRRELPSGWPFLSRGSSGEEE